MGHLLFGAILNSTLVWGAARLALARSSAATDQDEVIERLAKVLTIGAALIVLIVTLGGCVGILDEPGAMLVVTGLVSGAINWWAARHDKRAGATQVQVSPRGASKGSGWNAWPVALSVFLILLSWIPLACDRLALPPVAWDALTYHLQFPALWLETGRLMTSVPAVGDPAHTYYPLGGEMILYWTLLSTGSDLWVFATQIPFLLLGAWAIHAIAIRCGAPREGAALGALAWAGTPAILRQSVEPMVDVEMAALVLAAVAFALSARGRKGALPFLPAAACVGLLAAAKYSGVVFAVAIAPCLAWGVAQPAAARIQKVGFLLASVVLLAGYPYLRNVISGGTPFLPLAVSFGSWPFGGGSSSVENYFGPAARRLGWGEFLFSPRAILELGPAFLPLLMSIPVCLVVRFKRELGLMPVALVAVSGLLALVLAAFLLPFREHRYFFAVTGLAWSLLAVCVGDHRRSAWLRIGVPALIAIQVPVVLFYWFKDLIYSGATPRHLAAGFACLGLASTVAWGCRDSSRIENGLRRLAEVPRWVGAFALAMLLVLLAVGTAAYETRRYELWSDYWATRYAWKDRGHPRRDVSDIATSWQFVANATRSSPSVVAYAGSNLPYPLTGYGRKNRVVFVPHNADETGWRFGWGDRPPYPWRDGDEASWHRNLARLGVRYLCVYRLLAADDPETRFPIERAWAEHGPVPFRLVWERPWARVYEVGPARSPKSIAP